MSKFSDIIVEKPKNGVVCIKLNRPESKNAIRTLMLSELASSLIDCENNIDVRCVILTGEGENFAAGADIKEMAKLDAVGVLNDQRVQYWQQINNFSKPIIAAVNGYCMGGGCELAMHADIIIAGRSAKFGQPEINLGIIPGAGGTQRLIRCVGKSLASQMILSGELIDSHKALAAGLISEISEPELTLERAQQIAQQIANKAPVAIRLAKESLKQAFESSLSAGMQFERRSFVLLAATKDRNEGINAFLEKRQPFYQGE